MLHIDCLEDEDLELLIGYRVVKIVSPPADDWRQQPSKHCKVCKTELLSPRYLEWWGQYCPKHKPKKRGPKPKPLVIPPKPLVESLRPFRPTQIAAILKCTPATVYDYLARGAFDRYKIHKTGHRGSQQYWVRPVWYEAFLRDLRGGCVRVTRKAYERCERLQPFCSPRPQEVQCEQV